MSETKKTNRCIFRINWSITNDNKRTSLKKNQKNALNNVEKMNIEDLVDIVKIHKNRHI